jgi:hypothetical protein
VCICVHLQRARRSFRKPGWFLAAILTTDHHQEVFPRAQHAGGTGTGSSKRELFWASICRHRNATAAAWGCWCCWCCWGCCLFLRRALKASRFRSQSVNRCSLSLLVPPQIPDPRSQIPFESSTLWSCPCLGCLTVSPQQIGYRSSLIAPNLIRY